MALVPIREADVVEIRRAIQRLASIKLGYDSIPTFLGIVINSIATISTIVVTTAKISTMSIDSAAIINFTSNNAIITSLSVQSATISSLAVISLSGVTLGGIPVVTALYPSIEGDTVYLSSSNNDLYTYKEK